MAKRYDLINNHLPGSGSVREIQKWIKRLPKRTRNEAAWLLKTSPQRGEIEGLHNILRRLFEAPAKAPHDTIVLSCLDLYILTERLLARVIFQDAMRSAREFMAVTLLYGVQTSDHTMYDLNTWQIMIGDHSPRPIPRPRFNYKNPEGEPDNEALDQWRPICQELAKPQDLA